MAFDDVNTDGFDTSMLSAEERAGLEEDLGTQAKTLDAVIEDGKAKLGTFKDDAEDFTPIVKDDLSDDDDTETDPDLLEQERQAADEAARRAGFASAQAQADALAAEQAAAKADEPAAAAPAPAPAEPPEFQPVFHVPPVENYAERMQALDDHWAEVDRKWSDGEIPTEEKNAEFKKYLNERDDLRSANDRYQTYVQQQEQAATQRWEWEQNKFMAQAKDQFGVDYANDVEKNRALDAWIKHLAGKPDNADKSGMWFLENAHKKVMVEFDLKPAAQAKAEKSAADGNPPQQPAQKPDKRAPNLDNIPPTLGRLPAAAEGDTGKSEFSHLDGLEGTALELALARMTPEQQDRYLAAS